MVVRTSLVLTVSCYVMLCRPTAVRRMYCCHAVDVVSAILSTGTGSLHRLFAMMSTNC